MQTQKLKVLEALLLTITALMLVSNFQLPLTRAQSPSEAYIDVPYHPQGPDYYCGPACLEMIFDFYGPDIRQDQIADAARTDGTYPEPFGTYGDEMRRAAHFSDLSDSAGNELADHVRGYTGRGLGYAAFTRTDTTRAQLKSLLDAGYPIVVLQWNDLTHDWGHFRVVVGYDDTAQTITVHDPLLRLGGQNFDYSYADFDDLWLYSDEWALFSSPWDVSISYPADIREGDTFTVTATITYPRPSPFSARYSASPCQATIQLPPELSLATSETQTKTLTAAGSPSGTIPSGDSATAQWNVNAENTGSYRITVEAEGNVAGSVARHPQGVFNTGYTYTDRIGGVGSEDVTIIPWPPIGMMINPSSQSAQAGEWASYTVTVASLTAVEQTVRLRGPEYQGGRFPYCDWGPDPAPYSTQITLAPGETTEVTLNVRVDHFWPGWGTPPGSSISYTILVNGFSSLDGYTTVVASVNAELVLHGKPVQTATGTGTAYFSSEPGTITDLTAVSEDSLPPEARATKPEGVAFPHGLFSFTIECNPGDTVTVYIELPSPIAEYWKCHDSTWLSIPTYGENVISITLTDNEREDADPTLGTIMDPGGPAVLIPEVWSTDFLGNPKRTFLPGEEVYVKGSRFPPNMVYDSMTIYIIPDGESPLPENSVASAPGHTDETGALPVTLVWSPPLTLGEYDIWVDVNQNGAYDIGDAWNDQNIYVFAFNVIPEPSAIIGTLLMFGALATFYFARKRQLCLK